MEKIDWIEANGNYARPHAGSSNHEIRQTLKALEGALDSARLRANSDFECRPGCNLVVERQQNIRVGAECRIVRSDRGWKKSSLKELLKKHTYDAEKRKRKRKAEQHGECARRKNAQEDCWRGSDVGAAIGNMLRLPG